MGTIQYIFWILISFAAVVYFWKKGRKKAMFEKWVMRITSLGCAFFGILSIFIVISGIKAQSPASEKEMKQLKTMIEFSDAANEKYKEALTHDGKITHGDFIRIKHVYEHGKKNHLGGVK